MKLHQSQLKSDKMVYCLTPDLPLQQENLTKHNTAITTTKVSVYQRYLLIVSPLPDDGDWYLE